MQKPSLAAAGLTAPETSASEFAATLKGSASMRSTPEQAREFIGFKHINGPHKWDAIAKARFAANWYRKERGKWLTIDTIRAAAR
ncbi:MAG: hypothetical protein R2712_09350 [Vicinamibacterales bacterium]